jgi:hypothetical protein
MLIIREAENGWVLEHHGESGTTSPDISIFQIQGDEDATKVFEHLVQTIQAYVGVEEENVQTKKAEKMKYVIVRTYSAGVFAGELESRTGREVVMRNARRLWYWKGASSLSELAMKGVKYPEECKFPCAVDRVELLEAVEILDVTPTARKCIEEVPEWKQF